MLVVLIEKAGTSVSYQVLLFMLGNLSTNKSSEIVKIKSDKTIIGRTDLRFQVLSNKFCGDIF